MPTATRNISASHGFVSKDPFATLPPKPCRCCGKAIPFKRSRLGKTTCLPCQQDLDITEPVKHTVAIAYNKGAYQHIYNPADLFNTNPKQPRGA
jgi:hypothetical protein